MKKIKKITIIFICISFLLNINFVKAIEIPTEARVSFYGIKIYENILYEGENMQIPIAVCSYLEHTFPIYSLTQEKYGVSDIAGYTTRVNEILKNEKVRKILLYGYPSYSFEELGCSSWDEAYIITQIAILDVYYNYDLTKFSVVDQNKYPNTIQNMTNFIQKMRKCDTQEQIIEMTINEQTSQWQKEDNEYESKTYEILNNSELITNFTVKIETEKESDTEKIQIKNANNELQENFTAEEKFKIFVPENENINFEIVVTTEVETQPILKGNGPSQNWESYIFLGTTETIQTSLIQSHEQLKLDEENKTDEEGNLDEQGKPNEEEKTDEEGILDEQGKPNEEEKTDEKGILDEQGKPNEEEKTDEEGILDEQGKLNEEEKTDEEGNVDEQEKSNEEGMLKNEEKLNKEDKLIQEEKSTEKDNQNKQTTETTNNIQNFSKEQEIKKLPRTGC